MGGVESEFQFVSYKVDDLELHSPARVVNLMYRDPIPPDQIDMQLALRNPQVADDRRTYITGVKSIVELYRDPSKTEDTLLVRLRAAITGAFVVQEDMDPDLEQNLVKLQAPALLMAYMRTVITTVLSASGFGGVILPLVNMHALAGTAKLEIINLRSDKVAPAGNGG